jgi:TRAP-type C4-dicarboxylate transport system substrate-binding protein
MRRPLALTAAAALAAAAITVPASTEAQSPMQLNIGSMAPENTPWDQMLRKVEAHIEQRSANRINVVIRPPMAGMGEVEIVRDARRGERLQGAGVTTAALAEGGSIPVLQILELPYLFKNTKQADTVLDTLFQPISDIMKARGFILAVWSENGFRSYGTKSKAIRSPADLAGLKMRSQESDVHMATYTAFGANAVQQSMSEVGTSLRAGVIDGLDNSPVYIISGGFADSLKFYSLTEHCYQPAAVVYSRTWFEALPADLQAIALEPKPLSYEGRVMIRQEAKDDIALMPSMGIQVVTLTEAEKKAFADKGRAIHRTFAASIEGGTALLDKVNGVLATVK